MKRYIRSDSKIFPPVDVSLGDVNYHLTNKGTSNDSVCLAVREVTTGESGRKEPCYVTLDKAWDRCAVSSVSSWGTDKHFYYKEYPMSDIDLAIADFNRIIDKYDGGYYTDVAEVEGVLNRFHTSLANYISAEDYDNLFNNN